MLMGDTCALCTVHCVLCTVYCELCTVHFAKSVVRKDVRKLADGVECFYIKLISLVRLVHAEILIY